MKTIYFKTQSNYRYQMRSVAVSVDGVGKTTGFIAISEETHKPAVHSDGVWVFPNLDSAKNTIKKWR